MIIEHKYHRDSPWGVGVEEIEGKFLSISPRSPLLYSIISYFTLIRQHQIVIFVAQSRLIDSSD